jgi:hypothetical protein
MSQDSLAGSTSSVASDSVDSERWHASTLWCWPPTAPQLGSAFRIAAGETVPLTRASQASLMLRGAACGMAGQA